MKLAMIPARIGSERFKMKNLALIKGRPLITYALEAALESNAFDKVIINGDHESFRQIADEWNVEYYSRPEGLGSSITRSDTLIFDFMQSCAQQDTIVTWVNPISPLITAEDIRQFLLHFEKSGSDSCITTSLKYVHAKYGSAPLNYSSSDLFAKTQDLEPVELFDYSLMAWRSSIFIDSYIANGSAIFCGRSTTYNLPAHRTYHVKTLEDFAVVSALIENYSQASSCIPSYYNWNLESQ